MDNRRARMPVPRFSINTAADPRLIVGWRAGSRTLEAARVPLLDSVFEPLRAVATGALKAMAAAAPRRYEPAAELEAAEQYFVIPVAEVPIKGPGAQALRAPVGRPNIPADRFIPEPTTSLPDIADILKITQTVDTLPTIDARRLADGAFLFYGIVLPGPQGFVAFVKKVDPTSVVRRGTWFFQFGDALVSTARPDLVLYDDVDLIIGATNIVAFGKFPLEQVLSDVKLVLLDVPANVTAIRRSLRTKVPLTPHAKDALESHCATRPSLAARLRLLPSRLAQIELSADRIRERLRAHGEDPALLVNSAGEFEFNEAAVGAFLDVVEGRWFEDDFATERRRADRFSKRR